MADLFVTRVQDPATLLERAVAGLLPPVPRGDSPWPTLSAWIVLRQGGLRDDLHRLAAARGVAGWFENPVGLFDELADRWGPADPRDPLTEPERHSLLAHLMETHGARVFTLSGAEAWVPTVDRLIGELMVEDVEADRFREAMLLSARDAFAQERAEALATLYREWRAALGAHGRRDGRDARVRLAKSIVEDPQGFSERLGGRREVRIVGLADLRGGWRPLLRSLRESTVLDRVEVLTNASFEVDGAAEDSVPFTDAVGYGGMLSRASVRLVEAPDGAREMERVAVEVRALIDRGIEPHRIAVVAREARPAVDGMSHCLAALGVPVTARRRTALAHTAPARALLALLQVVTEGWSRHAIAEVAEHPLIEAGLDAGVINAVGFGTTLPDRAAWTSALALLHARALRRERDDDRDEDRRAPLPPRARVEATLVAWERVGAAFDALGQERSFDAWCAWATDALDDGLWRIGERLSKDPGDSATWHIELRARDRIRALLGSWREAATAFGGRERRMDARRFLERLRLILAQDLITMPDTDAGVVVAEALAAGWRAFDHVFLVGLSAGSFPLRPAEDALLDNEDREALRAAGIPLDDPGAWRVREADLFRMLCAAARERLTLSWPSFDGEGREAARSAFVDPFVDVLHPGTDVSDRMPPEQVLVEGYPLLREARAVAHARGVAARETERAMLGHAAAGDGAAGAPSPWNGLIEEPTLRAWLADRYGERFVWSATQLESVAKCPWHWFAARLLGVESRQDAEDLLEPTVRGALRHDALELFFTTAADERGRPLLIGRADHGWVHAGIREALSVVWGKALAAGTWLGPEATRTAQYDEVLRSLQRYLDFEMKFNDQFENGKALASKVIRSGFREAEVEFGPYALHGADVTFLLRGRADRVDAGAGNGDGVAGQERYLTAIDYKSSKWSTPGAGEPEAWDDGIVLQVPLYAKALQVKYPDHEVVRMEYRTLDAAPTRVHPLNLAPVLNGEIVAGDDALEARALLDGALDAAGRRVRAVRDGQLPAAPARSAGCSPYCPARDICRIPGGPRSPEQGER